MSNRQNEKSQTAIRVLQGIVILGFLVMFGRIVQLQIIDYETYSPLSMQNSLRMERVKPARGLIYDRKGTIMVENQPIYTITITPAKFNSHKVSTLSTLLQIDEELVIQRIREAQNYSWHRTSRLFTEVSFEVFSAIQENLWQLPGIGHTIESKRHYPTDVNASHLFGYLREASLEELEASDYIRLGDYIGKSGVERIYESYLRGERGTEYIRVNAYGQALGLYNDGALDIPPVKGSDLITTLDADIQALAEKLMLNKQGGLVAIDPHTGGIIAMVSAPQYDLSKLSGRIDANYWRELNTNPSRPLFNRAISARQPPGSTFKPFMGIIGLQMGLITPQTQVYNPGFYFRGRRYGDLADPGNYNLDRAIAKSSNTYFFWMMDRIASRGQLNTWSSLIQDFGMGPLNYIDLPFERSGIIPDSTYMNRTFGERRWGIGDLMSLGVGQGMVSVSPLQMAVATASLANGGYRVQPHIVSAVKEPNGEISYTNPVFEKIEWIQPDYLRLINQAMMNALMEGGSRYYGYIPGIPIAGKTGTAQNPHGENHGWFIAYAPADNPQIAIAVLMENSGFGSVSATPIASLIIEKYLTGEIKREHIYNHVMNFRPQIPLARSVENE
ncbi:MAG: penicillin-binding protein 2 [Balneolaceae bacterium]|nr:MAG: penicillin-binding protein 2 [Balneolaceae bacterium]